MPKEVLCSQSKHIPHLAGCPLSPKSTTMYLALLGGITFPLRPPIWPKVQVAAHTVLPLAVCGCRPSSDAAAMLYEPQGYGGVLGAWRVPHKVSKASSTRSPWYVNGAKGCIPMTS